MFGAFLLITSAFLHAFWNAMAKRSPNARDEVLGILCFAALFSLGFIPFFSGGAFPNTAALLWGIGAGAFEGGYMITLARTLAGASVGMAYTIMRGGAMVCVWVVSAGWMQESLTGWRLVGVLVVMSGLYLTSQSARRQKQVSDSSLAWPYLCAVFIAGYHLCYGFALEEGASPAPLFSLSLWIAVPALWWTNGSGRATLRKLVATRPAPVILGGLICALSFILFLVGLSESSAGVALTLRNTSVVFAQIFARFIGEKVSAKQAVGAVLVALGAAAVGLTR